MTRFVLLLPALLILLPASASPQGLGDAAAKEREKKAKSGAAAKPAPAFSNDDLASEKEKKKQKEEAEARGEEPARETSEDSRVGADGRKRLSDPDRAKERAQAATSATAPPESGLTETADPDEVAAAREAAEAYWRGRVDAARNVSAEMERRLASLRARIDDLRARISPMNPQQEQDVNRILAVQEEITAAEAEMESAQANLKNAREELVGLEEAARQAGIAPGVLRPPQ